MDINILLPFLIIFLMTILTIFLIYPSARFNRNDENSMQKVYSPLWFVTYCILFYSWCILSVENNIICFFVYLFSILQLLSLALLYSFMETNWFYYSVFIVSTIGVLIISIIYQKIKVFFLLIINILLFFYFSQTIQKSTWRKNEFISKYYESSTTQS